MTLPIKLTIGIVGTALTGASLLSAYKLIPSSTVRDHIEDKELILDTQTKISSSDTSNQDYIDWKKIIEKDTGSSTKVKDFGKWTTEEMHEKINKLREACELALNTPKWHEDFNKQLQNSKDFCLKIN